MFFPRRQHLLLRQGRVVVGQGGEGLGEGDVLRALVGVVVVVVVVVVLYRNR